MTDGPKKIIFIPDAHLKDPDDENYRALMDFLDGLVGKKPDSLVIIGDLFDFWMGYRSVVPYRHLPLLSRLESLARAGVAVHYTEGNHDFFVGPYFSDVIGAAIHPGPWEMTAGGLRLYIAHGDQVNRKDYGYRFLRRLLRSLPVRFLRYLIPPFVIEKIAGGMSRASRVYTDAKRDDTLLITRKFAERRFAEGYDAVVLGHFHVTDLWETKHGNKKRVCVNVGRWMDGRLDYVELSGGRFRMREFSPPSRQGRRPS
jgi:UDP-2,3-diacylglucosamine hydrolase